MHTNENCVTRAEMDAALHVEQCITLNATRHLMLNDTATSHTQSTGFTYDIPSYRQCFDM